MKFASIISALAILTSATTASPIPTAQDGEILDSRSVKKRVALSDACDVGYCTQNGGTKGGAGGATTTVSTLAEFTAAAGSASSMVIVVEGAVSGAAKVPVTSNKSIIGASGSSLTGIGLTIKGAANVIVRNMRIAKVRAASGDAITVQASSNVWVDHCDLSSDLDHGKDYYDGLCDVTHASEWVTVSNTYFHDHYKASLVGHSDNNGGEDTGHLHVTYANNHWNNINSRTPSFRFGTGHVFNSYFSNLASSGINARMGAQLLVESSAFANASRAITSVDSDEVGYARVSDVDLGGSTDTAPAGGTLSSVPYPYALLGSASVRDSVVAGAGQKLSF